MTTAAQEPQEPPTIDITWDELDGLREEGGQVLSPPRVVLLERLVHGFVRLQELIAEQAMTMARLRRLCGVRRSSEKTADVLGGAATGEQGPTGGPTTAPGSAPPSSAPTEPVTSAASDTPNANEAGPAEGAANSSGSGKPKKPRVGHGRLAFTDYPAAECIPVLHEKLRPGDKCPLCGKGTLYDIRRPAPIVRIVGQPPLAGTIWLCQNLRCTACGHLFTASAPEAAKGPKYDPTADAMLIVARYGMGLPHHRMAAMQDNFGIPVPPSTAWDRVRAATGELRPVFDELRRQAAQGQLLHGDDSYVRILAFMGRRRAKLVEQGKLENPERTGLFTSAVLALTDDGHTIALYVSSGKHLGENLDELLGLRNPGLSPPLLMSDALDRNVPKRHSVVESNCLQHGRRQVVDQVDNFPAECAHILVRIRWIYRIDALCRRHGYDPDKRLRVHQRFSGPVMAELHDWMTAQLADKRVEPNSGMGKAMHYFLKRWDKFTVFLHRPGAALDNNIAERALKMAIQHRRNSLFYLSQDGATAGDIAMTLIHTARLHGVNVFDYVTELLRHAKELAHNPAAFLPWTYRATIDRLMSPDRPALDPLTVIPPPGVDPVVGPTRAASPPGPLARPLPQTGPAQPAVAGPAMSPGSALPSRSAPSPTPL